MEEERFSPRMRIPLGKGFAGRIRRGEALRRPGTDENHANVLNPILRDKGIQSFSRCRCCWWGTVLRVLHVGTLSPRQFSADDAALLQLVADRIALAVHARTTQVERTAAAALQGSLLPPALPEISGLEFAARYVPGGPGQVGGDWYDVFTLPSGAVCVVVGDVVGRGLPAAVEMARLRGALTPTPSTPPTPPRCWIASTGRCATWRRHGHRPVRGRRRLRRAHAPVHRRAPATGDLRGRRRCRRRSSTCPPICHRGRDRRAAPPHEHGRAAAGHRGVRLSTDGLVERRTTRSTPV